MLQQQIHMSLRPLGWASQQQPPGYPIAAAPVETGATLPYQDHSQSAKTDTRSTLPRQLCCSITSGGQHIQENKSQPQTSSDLLLQPSALRSESQLQQPPLDSQLQSVLQFPKSPHVQVISAGFGASVNASSAPSANFSTALPANPNAALPTRHDLKKQCGGHSFLQNVSTTCQSQPQAVPASAPSQAHIQPACLSPFASYSLRLQECNAAAADAAAAALRNSDSPYDGLSVGASLGESSDPADFTARMFPAQAVLPLVKTGRPLPAWNFMQTSCCCIAKCFGSNCNNCTWLGHPSQACQISPTK